MADIKNIDVFQTVTSVSFEVEPNTNIININKVTGAGGAGGFTNLSTTQTATNFTINSDTGDDALVPLGNGTLAGATLNDYTTTEKNKLAGIAVGAEVNVNADWNATSGDAQILNKPTIPDVTTFVTLSTNQTITAIKTFTTPSNFDNVIRLKQNLPSYSTSSGYTTLFSTQGGDAYGFGFYNGGGTANFLDFSTTNSYTYTFPPATGTLALTSDIPSITGFVPYTGATTDVDLGLNDITANSFIKSGGTSSQILAADGSVITAGTNITITGGVISSVGGAGGGGSSVNYYLNGGTSQGTFGGTTYYEFSKTAVIGTGADFSRGTNGYIASFITDVADPSLLLIPAGNWNLEFFFSSSSAGGSPSFYVELYKYDGTTFTSIASSSANPEVITGGTSIDAYFTPLAVPETILTVNDRLAIRVFVNASSKTITLHTQNGHLCEVITTFSAGLTALNGLQAQVQNFATGTTGTDFDIISSGSTHTFNLPSASATARGVVSTTTQTFAGDKTFTGTIGASNLSNTNTGDETITTIKTKLGITTLSGSNTGDQDLSSYAPLASPTFTGTPSLPTGTTGTTQTPLNNSTRLATTAYVEAACAVVAASNGVTVSSQDTFGTARIATVTAAQYAAFVTAGTVSSTTLYFITA